MFPEFSRLGKERLWFGKSVEVKCNVEGEARIRGSVAGLLIGNLAVVLEVGMAQSLTGSLNMSNNFTFE